MTRPFSILSLKYQTINRSLGKYRDPVNLLRYRSITMFERQVNNKLPASTNLL